ncbi:MAG: hypothetical protein JKY27_03130 [Magnetovibrio sp.]|nr:hypothetical protein [Magnetovibrio sp.]
MKSKTEIQLNTKWWEREQPPSIKAKSGAAFLTAIKGFTKSNDELGKAIQAKKANDVARLAGEVGGKIGVLEKAGKTVAIAVGKLLKLAPADAKEKLDLENTLAVMNKPLARELDTLRGSLEGMEGDPDEGDLTDVEAYKMYLGKVMPKLRKGAYSFAIVMPSNKFEDLRMVVHRTKDGKVLAGPLRKASGGGKFTWGTAAAESKVEEVEDESSKTLILALDGKHIPGLAKKVKFMLRAMDIKTFTKVKLLIDGAEIETDETPENKLAKGGLAKDGATDNELNSLYESYKGLKARILPLVAEAMGRYPGQKAGFEALLKGLKKAEGIQRFDLGIAILRDKVVPLLKSSQRLASADDGNDTDIGKVTPAQAPRPGRNDLLNSGLSKVLNRTFPPENQSRLAALWAGSNKDITSGSDFFGAVKVSYPNGQTPANADQIESWAVNMATLQHMSTKVPDDSPEQKALLARQLGFLMKFANIPNSGDLGWQANPTQLDNVGTYHRSGSSALTKSVTKMTAASLGVPEGNTILVSGTRVLEEVRRGFSSEGELETPGNWSDADFDRVLRRSLAGESVFIDGTSLFRDAIAAGENPKTKAEEIIVTLKKRAFENAVAGRGKPGMTDMELAALGTAADRGGMSDEEIGADKKRVANELELKAAIERDHLMALNKLSNVRIGGIMAVGDQNALTVFPFDKDATIGGAATLELGAGDSGKLRDLVGHGGFTVGPEQLLDHWVSQTPDVAEILRGLGVAQLPKVEFPSGIRLDRFDDFEADFLDDPAVAGFRNLSQDDPETGASPPPYVKVMVDGLLEMVEGLELGERGFSVKRCLEDAGLEELWSLTLNKIQGLMAKATACKGSMRDFLDQVALIQEEIVTLIAVAKPYSQDDFQTGMLETTDMFPDGFLGDDVKADFSLKNSASRCFNAVLTACEDTKERSQGDAGHLAKRGLKVLVQTDAYYEPSMYVLDHATDHQQAGLNTDGLLPGGTEKDFDDQLDEMERAQREDNQPKLDTYLCEFHHNISYDRKKYSPEDVTKQVRKLVDKGVVANPFTVAIDTTIAKTDEAAVKTFLAGFADEIKDGSMNVIIYRSAQKFDQMGGDMYNGGIMCCISADNDGEPSPFQRALDSQGEAPSEGNLQGLTHLNLSAQDEINDYRAAIMENTRKMGDPNSGSIAAIPATMMLKPENADLSLIQIAVNEDDEAPFLDIKFSFVEIGDEPPEGSAERKEWGVRMERYEKLYADLQKVFAAKAKADPENSVTSTRASFGFQHSNVTLIGESKLRLNPGLEDEERLAKHTQMLVAVNDMLMQIKQDFADNGEIDPEQVEWLASQSGVIKLHVIEAHEELTAKLANDLATDDEKDLARLKMIEAFGGQNNLSCNPPGVLRIIGEMSDEFKVAHAQSIQICTLKAEATLDAISELSPSEKHLALARAANVSGLLPEVIANLALIAEPFENGSREKGWQEELQLWVDDKTGDWDDAEEQKLQSALTLRDANDPIGVKAQLDYAFKPEFLSLRQPVYDSLKEWVDDTYIKRIKATAEELIRLARAQIENGSAEDAKPYIVELERMAGKDMPGLPNTLAATITDLREAAKQGQVLRRIAAALSDACAFEATGNVAETRKRVIWVDKVIEAAPNVATVEQKQELTRLKEWLENV